MSLEYSFDAVKNELNYRAHHNFGIKENFKYDDNNRLIDWTNPKTGQMSFNKYDETGRILHNDQLGDIGFNIGGSPYRVMSIKLNAQGVENYDMNGQSRLLQQITYNENNDPVKIDGTRGDYSFAYGLSESRQIMYFGGNFKNIEQALYNKYYSESGDAEIIIDRKSGKERHILYIGGTPYETDIVFTNNIGFDGGGYKFLHKDYLGSILAISDEEGNAEERRHYDAWGIFTHLKIKEGNIYTGKGIEEYLAKNSFLTIDRGYTSHEHLYDVELIHMNGRLYDPLLRRFLNADENIQDPFNTQSYNKYGYVINNPLMFNDPSGEIFIAASFLVPMLYGAIIGAVVGAGVYTIKSLITGNWTWSGFGKSILVGAVTGAVSGGLSSTYTATGFTGAVVMGSINGGVVGGVDALLNGKNFATGFYRGGLSGAAIGAVSYVVSSFVSYYKAKKPDMITTAELESQGYDVSNQNNQDYYTTDQQVQNDFSATTGDYQASTEIIQTEFKLATEQNLPSGMSISSPWKEIISDKPSDLASPLGITFNRNNGWLDFMASGQKTTVLIAPNLGLKSDILKRAVFGHEYIHAYHRYIGLAAKYGASYSNYTESSAYHYTIGILRYNGQDYSGFMQQFLKYKGTFPEIFHWKNAINKIVNYKY